MSKQHSNSTCAKSSKTTQCNCQMCWGFMHGAQNLDLNSQIEEAKKLLSPAKGGSGENIFGVESKRDYIRFHREVVLKKYLDGDNNPEAKFWKLSEKVNASRVKINENVEKEYATFEKDPENYIKSNCLDTASQQLAKQVADALMSNADKGQGVKECINLIVNHQHLFCVICVVILKLVEKGEKKSSTIASAIAKDLVELIKVVVNIPELTEEIVKTVLKTILTKAFSRVVKTTILSVFPQPFQDITTVQILGVITCPDIEKHSDVAKYCAKPLLEEVFEKGIRDQLEKFYDQAMKGEGSCPVIEFSFSQ